MPGDALCPGPRLLPGTGLVPDGCSLNECGMTLAADAFLFVSPPEVPTSAWDSDAPQKAFSPPKSKPSWALS